jgi:DNA repair ATPase RecN
MTIMKPLIFILVVSVGLLVIPKKLPAQANELAQLALNIEKLAQFKQILSDLKKGYEILSGGYNQIKTLSKGNFELHKLFLDGLMEVNPAVKNYKHVADIIKYQIAIINEYKSSYHRFKESNSFSINELKYMGQVYGNLLTLSLKNLDDLVVIITSNKLRMSDEERLTAIDNIYNDMQDKLMFIKHFNGNNSLLSLQRAKEEKEIQKVKKYFGAE